jgi:hypothetical protein
MWAMCKPWWLPITAILLALVLAGSARSEERSLVLLFGPTGEENGRQAAHSVADTTHDWLQIQGAGAELRRAGVSEGQVLTKHQQPKDLEQTFLDAAGSGRQTDLVGFLNALDKASYALARLPGKRLLIVILESPPPEIVKAMKGGPEELDSRLSQTADFCRSKAERVVVLDPSAPVSKEPLAALKSLAGITGGLLVREMNSLAAGILTLVPPENTAKAENAAPSPTAAAPVGLPVHTRFIRTFPMRANNSATDMGPMTGWLLVECPIGALQSSTDGGKYVVQARVTETVRNAAGKSVWEAKKDIAIKEPLKKQQARKDGNLYFMRELHLPGGQYTIEAVVEDQASGKSGKAGEALRATDSLPGFAVSDALFVRPLNESADRFDADQVLAYDGKALAPMLDPVFIADEAFSLRLYFIIYPDLRGAKPEMSLEILRNGQAVGRSQLAFNDEIRNTAAENGTMGGKGDQKHEFPYLAEIRDASFDAGQYEARVTIRQGRNTVTRVVPFRVVRAPGPV